ncbi:C-3 sterol dehydrogenase [Xylogone sp. PMI_703]|nr:C-3 sterol dehydrogenase [Xylogone sp. PMI_703]
MAESYLIIGGSGFLGSHVVEQLISRGEKFVAVYDINQPLNDEKIDGVKYYVGDITDEAYLTSVLKEVACTVLFHTASPVHGLQDEVYYHVNETGTTTVLNACRNASVGKLVYTSSTGVVWTGADIVGKNEEQLSYPPKGYDAYHHTKAIAERLVLAESNKKRIQTAVLRPCGMIGERDKQLLWRLATVLKDGQQNIQIGDNTNLVDYMYVGNAAHAHLLAADRLCQDAAAVDGQIFFMTNAQPMPMWDFNRIVWKELGDDGKKSIIVIPRYLGMPMAIISEFFAWLTGRKTQFSRFAIRYVTGIQWYNIEKARNLLGYKPQIRLEEGIHRSVIWWKEVGEKRHNESAKT